MKPPIDLFCNESNNCDPEVSIYIPSAGYSAPCYNQAYSGGPARSEVLVQRARNVEGRVLRHVRPRVHDVYPRRRKARIIEQRPAELFDL